MFTQKKSIATILIAFPIIAIFLLFNSTGSLCACYTVSQVFRSDFHFDPMNTEPEDAKTMFLEKFSVGASLETWIDYLNQYFPVSGGYSELCTQDQNVNKLKCAFTSEKNVFSTHGFNIYLEYDNNHNLIDVSFSQFSTPVFKSEVHHLID